MMKEFTVTQLVSLLSKLFGELREKSYIWKFILTVVLSCSFLFCSKTGFWACQANLFRVKMMLAHFYLCSPLRWMRRNFIYSSSKQSSSGFAPTKTEPTGAALAASFCCCCLACLAIQANNKTKQAKLLQIDCRILDFSSRRKECWCLCTCRENSC